MHIINKGKPGIYEEHKNQLRSRKTLLKVETEDYGSVRIFWIIDVRLLRRLWVWLDGLIAGFFARDYFMVLLF